MSKGPDPINEKLLLEQAGFIRALSRTLVPSEGFAEDLGQEACLAAIEHPPKQGPARRSWLRRVLRNKAGCFEISGTDHITQVTAWHPDYTPQTVLRDESR